MKKMFFRQGLALAMVVIFLAASSLGEARDFHPKIFADINREAKKSVVIIFGGVDLLSDNPIFTGAGTGFLVEGGLIMTVNHIISKSWAGLMEKNIIRFPEFSAQFLSGESAPLEIVARSPLRDIAIMKIKGDVPPTFKFPTGLKLGDSSAMEAGDMVLTIGHPFDFFWSVSFGIISALREDDFGALTIQTDMTTNIGNSGGPLLNLEGEVIGVMNQKQEEAIGFAVSVNVAKRILAQAIAREKEKDKK